MKTRQELILDFMLALASGVYAQESFPLYSETSDWIYKDAERLADKYLENV